MAGLILVNGKPASKSGAPTGTEDRLELAAPACPYVSRGGLKLEAALKAFPITVSDTICLDVGASTGGFTDCLLQHGAQQVYAVDVGRGQLHEKLRADGRVVCLEKTHARSLSERTFSPAPRLAVIDVSFISLTAVLPAAAECLAPGGAIVALIKPQFELTAKQAPKGVVRDPVFRSQAVEKVRRAASDLNLRELGFMESPLKGAKGNVEFLIAWEKSGASGAVAPLCPLSLGI